MNTQAYNKLIELLNVQSNSTNEKLMVLYLDKELKRLKLDYTIDPAGNILVTKGKATTYPCVVSHMDTVHDIVGDFRIYYDAKDKDILFAKNGKSRIGIGGDDKCGVFACLYLLDVMPNIKVVFFSREEKGCAGSSAIDKVFFDNCRYLIQLDRRGKRDFIQTYWGNKTVSHEFSSEIGLVKKEYKYKAAVGTVTDVMTLWKNKVGISCVNLSAGYYKPHSNNEYISIKALWWSVKFTEAIINTLKPKRYPSLPPPPVAVTTNYNYGGYKQNTWLPCAKCSKYKKEILLYHLGKEFGAWAYKKVCYLCKEELKEQAGISNPPSDNKLAVIACFECGKTLDEMVKGDNLTHINGELYCGDCSSLFSVLAKNLKPSKCWVCNRIIPKDHKDIRRFGNKVCGDCSCPSDTEYVTDGE